MMKALYTPLSGAVSQERMLEIIANNLANMNTTAFKGEGITFTLLEPEPEKHYRNPLPPANYKLEFEHFMPLIGNDHSYVGVAGVSRDQSQGPVIKTGNSTDLMIEGQGYFLVNTPDGERYTRDGALKINERGVLVTQSNHPVMGDKGSIVLGAGEFQVNYRGEVYKNGQMLDRIKLFNFKEAMALERVGANYFYYGGPPEERLEVEHARIHQGAIEGSNVNAIKNMTAMIMAHRSYEAYQKAVKNFDMMMDKSSNSIGEIRA